MIKIENYTGKKYCFPSGFSYPKGEATYTVDEIIIDVEVKYSVYGLPEPKENTLYMVSPYVIMAVPNRTDLISLFDATELLRGRGRLDHCLA